MQTCCKQLVCVQSAIFVVPAHIFWDVTCLCSQPVTLCTLTDWPSFSFSSGSEHGTLYILRLITKMKVVFLKDKSPSIINDVKVRYSAGSPRLGTITVRLSLWPSVLHVKSCSVMQNVCSADTLSLSSYCFCHFSSFFPSNSCSGPSVKSQFPFCSITFSTFVPFQRSACPYKAWVRISTGLSLVII